MKYKRNFIIILVSIIIYIMLNILYTNIFKKSNEQTVFVLREDVPKGKEITIESIETITLKNYDISKNYILDISSIKDKVVNLNVYEGQILSSDMFIQKSEYLHSDIDEEIVAIKVNTAQDSTSYRIGKNTIANIYYTGKTNYANEILKEFDSTNVVSGDEPGYVTVKLINNVEILGVYDKYGNEIKEDVIQNSGETLIDTILINTTSDMAMKIYNLSRYGEFSISILN